MDESEILKARDDFRTQATAVWASLREGDSAKANANTDEADAQVERWAADGVLLAIVRPLLDDAAPVVRYAAAAGLLGHGIDKDCEQVLEELQSDPKGLIAPTARLLLMTRKRNR